MTTEERVKQGKLYFCDDPEFIKTHEYSQELMFRINQYPTNDNENRQKLYKQFFGHVGKNLQIEGHISCSWGKNIFWGDNCFANFNFTVVDDVDVIIGDNTMFAPNVTISTTGHPIHPELRKKTAQFSLPIVIGKNVWVGAGSIILPGVHIGDNSVIGAGSVVTKDIPENVVAYGTPCRVIRPISEHDYIYYWRDKEIDLDY